MASGKNFLMIEELNSDAGEPQMLRDFPLSNTVKDLKMAIARMIDETADWQTIMAIFVGEEMEDSECKALANYLCLRTSLSLRRESTADNAWPNS